MESVTGTDQEDQRDRKLKDVVDAYLASRDYQSLASSTKRNTERALSRVSYLLGRPAKRLTRGVIMGIMDEMPAGTAYVFGSRMRAMFGFAMSRELVTENPMTGVKMPMSGEYRPLTAEELALLLGPDVDDQIRMAVMLAYYTAQRISDVLKMRWDEITPQGAIHVRQKKTKMELYVPIHPVLRAALDNHMRDNPMSTHIVSMADGGRYSTDTFRRKFSRERTKLGLPKDVHFHGIRKTIASVLAAKGASTHEIMALGGWTTLKQVQGYSKGADQFALAKGAMARLT